MLEALDLTKDYKKFRAVEALSFRIEPGEIVGLLGPNGAGKTTVLRCIAGILQPTYGQVRINGHDIVAEPSRAKQGLAFVPEVPSLYELLTVREHLKFIAMCFDALPVYQQEADELLRRYVLADKQNDLVATLSKGMRQKLSIACAMIHRANLMLFDEPLIGIDPAGVAEVKTELYRAKSAGCCILVSTHLLDTAEKLCDRVIILNRGRKIAEGTLAELRTQSHMEGAGLEELFLRLTQEAPLPTAEPVR